MSPTPQGVAEVVERPDLGRFEMSFAGGLAFASFRVQGDKLIVTHTEVPAGYNGMGQGSRLVEGIFRQARQSGRRIVPACSFVADWVRRHPEFTDVVTSN